MTRIARWWRRRTLHGRLALLVTAAVSAALVTLSVAAWLAVGEIQQHQTQSQLTADAAAIAAQPDQWLSAAGCVLGTGGAALLGRLVARSGLAPVQDLTGAVENVAVTMDLDRPLKVEGTDEIARLGTSVNTLLEAIGAARQAQRPRSARSSSPTWTRRSANWPASPPSWSSWPAPRRPGKHRRRSTWPR
ncbi:HAMP domain-containing protein [Paractinoplanes durhamensis]|uniref:HAMP domain-containing protein n=1 Tax=Paractinoplanes durhamensis TaxID=113563 RepID=A0ABQ3YR93_9ACTN|nr:HAMP domain-containing protein [Actinoplanes durhamensis]GIE00113.1 hypothetical protein Adu01nite_14630 [Actinoplanes durhamensis]